MRGLCGALLILLAVHAHAASVGLSWTRSTSTDVAGYRVWHGVASRQYDTVDDVGDTETATVEGLQAGTRYYFAATAYASTGLESVYSNEVSAVVGQEPSEPPPAEDPPPPADTEPPWVAWLSPTDGDIVPRRQTIPLKAEAADNVGVATVLFYDHQGTLLCTRTAVPYDCTWVAPAAAKKVYELEVEAVDAAGNATSAFIRVRTP